MDSIFINGEFHNVYSCPKCKTFHSVPPHLDKAAQERRETINIYCPNGHSWVFKSKLQISEEDEIRQERDRLRQKIAEKDDEIKLQKELRKYEEHRVIAYKGIVTKTKKRLSGGACPCCNRTFSNLASHMKTKHKDYAAREEIA